MTLSFYAMGAVVLCLLQFLKWLLIALEDRRWRGVIGWALSVIIWSHLLYRMWSAAPWK